MSHPHRWRLDGQLALVTGASAGIGLAAAAELLALGADVLLVARDADALEAARDELTDAHPERMIEGFAADVADDEERRALLDWVEDQGEGLHILVNAVGAGANGSLLDLDEATWRAVFETGLFSAFELCRYAQPLLARHPASSIVNVGAASGLRVIPDTWAQATYLGSSRLVGYLGTNLSPALLGVGYIVGLNVGIVVLSGSILSWHIAIPLYQQFFMGSDPALAQSLVNAPAADAAFGIWGAKIRYLGVGAMLIGGVWTLFSLRKSLFSGIKSGFAAARKSGGGVVAETERDLPMKWMLVALVLFVMPLLALYQAIVGQWLVSVPMTIIMIVAGFLFVSVSGYLAGLVGSSNNPVSGITIATILFASVVLLMLLGEGGKVQVGGAPLGAVAAIMIGAVVCCAAAVGGDNLQDLKTGYLVGATPWKQQLMLGIGAFSCALIMAPVLNLLQKAYGIGSKTLPAPQANLMASVAKGLFGGDLPWTMIIIGGVIGAVVIAIDSWLKKTGKRFRVPVLAAAIGIYLPLELMVPIFLGGLLAHLVARFHKVHPDDEAGLDRVHRPGVLFSAGLITGEALMGIAIALPIVITQNPDVLALPFSLGAAAQWVGLAILFLVGWLLYRTGKKGEQAA